MSFRVTGDARNTPNFLALSFLADCQKSKLRVQIAIILLDLL